MKSVGGCGTELAGVGLSIVVPFVSEPLFAGKWGAVLFLVVTPSDYAQQTCELPYALP